MTVETFLKWKAQFEEETGVAKKREINDREGKKLTGRELFIRDKSLNESDLKFLEDGMYQLFQILFYDMLSLLGEAVKVDESLFQDLDDLDLSDDDDEDFDPNKYSSGEDS